MQKNLGINLAILLMSMILVLTVSCQKKTLATDNKTNSTAQAGGYDTSTTDPTLYSSTTEAGGDSAMVLQENIYFDYDKATLTAEAIETLATSGNWLRLNSDIAITIEGHCDERGTNGYNLALGDRRAESVKTFLVDLGIDRSRLATVSYGEERPLDRRKSKTAWAKNRRAHFLIR
jgi:peptidoglycan-associated lipoprotein